MRPMLVILAGGKGTRLGSLTKDIPKPMVDVHGKPFLHWLLEHYASQGFKDVILSTGYLNHVIENYPHWPIEPIYMQDSVIRGPSWFYEKMGDVYIVNGDTFIPDPLPDLKQNTILIHNGIDAGAQYRVPGKIHVHEVSGFYDIGTPLGLERFREYAETHLVKKIKNP